MAVKGIRIEFRRSLLTTLTIICALAFLSFVWTDSVILSALRQSSGENPTLRRMLLESDRFDERPSQIQRRNLLVSMSLLVCMVGISNAMAMSVTERFQQIGTMKCLGALNSFIARLFVLEAVFLGLIGTVVGDMAGIGLAVAREMFIYGAVVFHHFPWLDLLLTGLYTILVGVGISLLGALYPAIVAARMEPVQAMRVTA